MYSICFLINVEKKIFSSKMIRSYYRIKRQSIEMIKFKEHSDEIGLVGQALNNQFQQLDKNTSIQFKLQDSISLKIS